MAPKNAVNTDSTQRLYRLNIGFSIPQGRSSHALGVSIYIIIYIEPSIFLSIYLYLLAQTLLIIYLSIRQLVFLSLCSFDRSHRLYVERVGYMLRG